MTERLYSLGEAAKLLGVSKPTARRAYHRSSMVCICGAGAVLLTHKQVYDLLNYCEQGKKRAATQQGSSADSGDAEGGITGKPNATRGRNKGRSV